MFGTNLLERRSRPERIADQAWAHLTAAVGSAGNTIRHTARDGARMARDGTANLAVSANGRAGPLAGEAALRAHRAYDALAGRRAGPPWAWLIGTGLIGAALGWAAGMATRAAAVRADELRAVERVELVDVDRPDSPVSLGV